MSLRLIEVFLPQSKTIQVQKSIADSAYLGIWHEQLDNNQVLVKVLIYSDQAEPLLDRLSAQFQDLEGFRLLLLPVEASIPRPEKLNAETMESDTEGGEDRINPSASRRNREELYTDIINSIQLSWMQLSMIFLSTIIAAVGLLQNSEAVIIGAMVIAPLLKPNMGLALATSLGDVALARRTLKTGAVGIGIALAIAIVIGYVFPINLELPQIAMRTKISLADVVVAFASGMAGAISLTAGETSAIVGVMVSVALLPPLVTLGMLLGSGHWDIAIGTVLLFLTNLVCLNLAGIVTLAVQKVSPGQWLESYKAKRITIFALSAWLVLLFAMVGLIVWRRHLQV